MSMPSPKTLFISYSHKDKKLKDEFLPHLSSLKREGLISAWHDREIPVGGHLDETIQGELASSDIIMLLISAHFLSSYYCVEKEMKQAFWRARLEDAFVMPVILTLCDWPKFPVNDGYLGDFKALPEDGKAVKNFSDRNNAWLQIIQGLRAIVSEPEKQTSPKVGPDRTVTDIPAGSAKDATAQPSPASNLLSFRTAPSDVESPTINRLLFFNTHNADVTPEAANVVKLAAREILERDCKRVTVSGHCDRNEGSIEISSMRVCNVVQMLESLGVPRDIIEVAWFGDRYANQLGRSVLSRRVVIGLDA